MSEEPSGREYFVRRSERLVEAWSVRRPPFVPRGWLLDLKNEIGQQVNAIKCNAGEALHGKYVSPDKSFCDVENVLFYNIGPTVFARSTKWGLRFERSYENPPDCPKQLSEIPTHYSEYSVSARDSQFRYWTRRNLLAEWKGATLRSVSTNLKPGTVWLALKRGNLRLHDRLGQDDINFGLDLTIKEPPATTPYLASVVKPLLDGVICAFHEHNGQDEETVGARLSSKLNEDPTRLVALLRDGQMNILGRRRLV